MTDEREVENTTMTENATEAMQDTSFTRRLSAIKKEVEQWPLWMRQQAGFVGTEPAALTKERELVAALKDLKDVVKSYQQELKAYREGGVTEELLRKQDGSLKVGKGCLIVRADDYEAMQERIAFLEGELRWVNTRWEVPVFQRVVEVRLNGKLVEAKRIYSVHNSPLWQYRPAPDTSWYSMSDPTQWRPLKDEQEAL